jgi:monoamine oxidase
MHVGIVGAGLSGLYAGLLPSRESHQVTIYERTNRVGGRIFTHHFTSAKASKDVYFEPGAVRIPRSRLHSRVFDLIDYLNKTGAKNNRIRLIPYELPQHKILAMYDSNEKGLANI